MLNLVKYEIKTVWKDLLIVLAVMALLNLALITRINVWKNDLVFGLSCLIFFGGLVAVFISNIKIFTRDLKEDTGYLLFTLPQSGYSILGEKLVVSLIEILLTGMVGIFFIVLFSNLISESGLKFPSFLQVIVYLYEYASIIIFIYFVVIITKMIMKGRRLSGFVEIVLFTALTFVSYKVDTFLSKIFPQRISLSGAITNFQVSSNKVSYGTNSYNIASGIFDIIVAVTLFVVIARVLEKKIEL